MATFGITTMLNHFGIYILSLCIKNTIHLNHLEVLSAYARTWFVINEKNVSFNRRNMAVAQVIRFGNGIEILH